MRRLLLNTRAQLFVCTNITLAKCYCSLTAECESSDSSNSSHGSDAFTAEILRLRAQEQEMRERWIRDEDHWRKLPARAWPEHQPKVDDIPSLRSALKECNSTQDVNKLSKECLDTKFHLGTALLFNCVDPAEGMQLYEWLANTGDVRGMTAAAVCLLEGLGVDRDDKRGVQLLKQAAEMGYPQAIYELAVLHYTGGASPYIEEDNATAYGMFELAASLNHTCAQYMVADMLMTGEAGKKDLPRAVQLLYTAGEKGHRFARSTLLRVLDNEEKYKLDASA